MQRWIPVALVALLAGCVAPPGDEPAGCIPVDGFTHVHGLAVGADDPRLLYIATHHGLIRGTNDTDWCRLGPVADYMGFTAHPTDGDTFWVSGHPAGGGNLGVLQSTDGGHTWDFVGAEGADFHAMTVSRADPDRLWGLFQGRVQRSDDGGDTWQVLGTAPGLIALAAHSNDREVLYGGGQSGIHRSTDGGAGWQRITDRATIMLATHPTDAGTMLALFQTGLYRSTNGGSDWDRLPLDADGVLVQVAYAPTQPSLVYAATGDGAVHKSTDDGGTWMVVR